MIEKLDDLIEYNLKHLFESPNHFCWIMEMKDLNGQPLYESEKLARMMQSKGLLDIDNERGDLSEFGFNIATNGGWKAYLKEKKEFDQKIANEKTEKERIELELAKSNIEANELNKKVERRNKRETIINIILGFLNLTILAWQVLKSE